MGFFNKLFQAKKALPELDENSPYARYLEEMQDPLKKLVSDTPDRIEVIPSQKRAFAFIGKPPKRFGVAWVDKNGEIVNFKRLVEEKGLPADQLEKLSVRLREIYINHKSEPRYYTLIQDKQVVVTPSEPLLAEVEEVIDETVQ
ncbi:MAG: hypothetical protein PVI60_05575 [Desulfobacteraceae bacterium]|jgi:hypothetical protein